jgi:hypothetical protein
MAEHFNPYMDQFDSRNIFSRGQILGNGVITEMDEYLEEEHDDQRIMDIHKTLRVQIELAFLLLAKKNSILTTEQPMITFSNRIFEFWLP